MCMKIMKNKKDDFIQFLQEFFAGTEIELGKMKKKKLESTNQRA